MEQLLTTLTLYFLLFFIFDGVTPSPTPDANLLCISECNTCPIICSPPPFVESKPPPLLQSKPPPSSESKPPPKSLTPVDSEPPPYLTPIYHPTPPQSYYQPPMPPTQPPLRPKSKSCPPPSYITLGTNAAPPPPKLVVVPSTQIPPSGNNGQPYYYFYTSKGVAFSQGITGFLILFTCFYFMCVFIG